MEHGGAVFRAEFSPDGRWVLTASNDGIARTWEATTGTPVSAPMTHDGRLHHATFSPDGALVATAGADNTARVWDAATGQPVTAPLRHLNQVDRVAFDPASRAVITASRDHTSRIYQLPMERDRLTGKATQSTTDFGGVASRANDGNTDGNYANQSVTHTLNNDSEAWWQLELKEPVAISEIVLWNRQNWQRRLVNFRVRLLDAADQEVWGQDYLTEPDAVAPNPNLGINLATEPVAAKVRIEKIGPTVQGEHTLSLAEVEVFAASGFGRSEHTFAALQQFSQVAATSEISDEGSLEALSRDNLQTAWESIQSTSLVQPSGGDDAAWHHQRAKRLHEAKHWSGFFFHHARMQESDQQTARFIAMEASAHAELGHWDKALDLHLKAAKTTPDDIKIVSGCLTLCAHQGRLAEGQKLLDSALGSFAGNQSALRNLAFGAITHPEMFQDISVPLGWMNAQYEQRPGYIDLGDSEALRLTEAITMEGWFRSNSNFGLVNKGGSHVDDGFGFTLGDNIVRIELQNTRTQEKTMEDVPLQRNREWFHLAATWDIKSRELICYIGGARQDQVGFFNGPIGVSDQRLNLGRNERYGNRYCSASFSEFRIWNRARTGEEIRSAMNTRLKGDEPGLVGYWPFDLDTGTTARRGLAGGTDGEIVNPIWRTTDALPFSDEAPFCEVSVGRFNLWQLLTLQGGLQYRNGDFEQAAKTLESARIGGARRPAHMLNPDDGFDLQWLLLAQCYHQLGEKEKAAGFLKLANERITETFLGTKNWQTRLRLGTLLAETRKMLGQDQGQTN
jgi:Flp pilus assembly protein TadD